MTATNDPQLYTQSGKVYLALFLEASVMVTGSSLACHRGSVVRPCGSRAEWAKLLTLWLSGSVTEEELTQYRVPRASLSSAKSHLVSIPFQQSGKL